MTTSPVLARHPRRNDHQIQYNQWQPWEISSLCQCVTSIKAGDIEGYNHGWQQLSGLQQLRALGGMVLACCDLVGQCLRAGVLDPDNADVSVPALERMVEQIPENMRMTSEALLDVIALCGDLSAPNFWAQVLMDPQRYWALLMGGYTSIASWLAAQSGLSLGTFTQQHLSSMASPELIRVPVAV
jgi:hypothetical protein